MADWIKEQYRPFVRMCKGLYSTPPKKVDSYTLNSNLTTSRVAVYADGDYNVVVLRGTSTHKSDGKLDLADDVVIATGHGTTTLEKEATAIIKQLKGTITLTGHSLGGYAALKLAKQNNLKCCVFNAGTSPKAPVTTGPGNDGIDYHIVGDLISAYISDSACTVVRVDLGISPLDTLYAHEIDRFLGGDKVKGFLTADQENAILKGVEALIQAGINLVGNASPQFQDALSYITPILNYDLPDISQDDEDALIAGLSFLGVGKLAPGLLGVLKAKGPLGKVKAILSVVSDPEIQKEVTKAGEKLKADLDNVGKKLDDGRVKLAAFFHTGKLAGRHAPEVVAIAKNPSQKEIGKLHNNIKEVKPAIKLETVQKSFEKLDKVDKSPPKYKPDNTKEVARYNVDKNKYDRHVSKIAAKAKAGVDKVRAAKAEKHTSLKQKIPHLAATKDRVKKKVKLDLKFAQSIKEPPNPKNHTKASASAKMKKIKKKLLIHNLETKAIPKIKQQQINAKTPMLVAPKPVKALVAPKPVKAPYKPVPLNPAQKLEKVSGYANAQNQLHVLKQSGALGVVKYKKPVVKKPAFKIKLPKFRL